MLDRPGEAASLRVVPSSTKSKNIRQSGLDWTELRKVGVYYRCRQTARAAGSTCFSALAAWRLFVEEGIVLLLSPSHWLWSLCQEAVAQEPSPPERAQRGVQSSMLLAARVCSRKTDW